MATEPEVIPAEFSDELIEEIAQLPSPLTRDASENGTWVQNFGNRAGGPFIAVHGSDAELKAVVFPQGVVDEDGTALDAPASIGPKVFISERAVVSDNKVLMAGYAAKVALELAHD